MIGAVKAAVGWQRCAVAVVAVAGIVMPPWGLGWQLAVCVPVVAAFGLPHGATDWALARLHWAPRFGAAWPAVFAGFYGVLMGLVALAAWLMPEVALAAFVALAAWHFGREDAAALGLGTRWTGWIACGVLPVCGGALFWPGQVAEIIRLLGVGLTPDTVGAIGAGALVIWAPAAGWALVDAGPARRVLAMELALMLALQAAAPPLVSFATYFCVLHGPRHMASLPPGLVDRSVVPVSLVAVLVLACPVVWWAGAIAASAPVWTAASASGWAGANGMFWGLACLTLPHVLLGRVTERSGAQAGYFEGIVS